MKFTKCRECNKNIMVLKFIKGLFESNINCEHCGNSFVVKNSVFSIMSMVIEFVVLPLAVLAILIFDFNFIILIVVLILITVITVVNYIAYRMGIGRNETGKS
ncbi:MAG: hypothetical protein KJO88_01910 [Gammaproteobacteria bacterium]|nr:hypothetical protein [Gammaproteobacteria bacterium]